MSTSVESNRVHSYLIKFASNSNDASEGFQETVEQRFVRRIANKFDSLYCWDQDKTRLLVEVFKPLARNALQNYDSSVILLGSENTGTTFLWEEGRDNVVFNTVEYLFSEMRQETQERLLFLACFDTVGTTLVDYVGNYLGNNVQYSYSVSKTSVSLLRIQNVEEDMQTVKMMFSEEGRNRNYQRVLQLLISSSSNAESHDDYLSGISFILFSDCNSLLERISQLNSLKIDPCSEPSRVLFYPFSIQSMSQLIIELVCSALGGARLGAILVLSNLQDLGRNEVESLASFASALCRIQNNPSRSLLKLQVSPNERIEVVAHPRLYNLDTRLKDSQLEIDQAKHRFGVTRTRKPTPGSATWRSFLKSLKIVPSGESLRRLVLDPLGPQQLTNV